MLIVTYHGVSSTTSPVTVTASGLEADLRALARAGFEFVTLDDCADWLDGGRLLPERAAAITFDDGYESVANDAVPLLERLRVPATVYVVVDRIGGDNAWPGQWPSVPVMRLAGIEELRRMAAAGVAIGCHTAGHPDLTRLDEDALAREMAGAADRLEQLMGRPVRHFAYPYGRAGTRECGAAAGRFRTAVTAEARLVTRRDGCHALPRLDAHDLRVAITLGLLENGRLRPYLAVRRVLRRARRLVERAAA